MQITTNTQTYIIINYFELLLPVLTEWQEEFKTGIKKTGCVDTSRIGRLYSKFIEVLMSGCSQINELSC